jgi:1-acyl-sn-glycerol-3-phosphate acyltransferase
MSANPADTRPATPAGVRADELLAQIHDIVCELHPHMRGRLRVTMDSALDRDLGLDSLARVELLVRLERRAGVSLSDHVLASAETPRDVLRAMLAAVPGARDEQGMVSVRDVAQAEVAAPAAADTLLDALDWHLRAHPERTHVHLYEGAELSSAISYRDLVDGAVAVAGGLQRLGLEPGQSVAIMLPTGSEYLSSFAGILLAGGVPVPIYPPARLTQVEDHFRRHARILDNAGAVMLITVLAAKRISRLLTSHTPALRRVVTVPELVGGAGAFEPVTVTADTVAFLQYTSGSTGNPKGVVLTHGNLLASLYSMGEALQAKSSDVFVSWLPLYHDMGLIGAWLGSLVYGFPLVLMSPLNFLARPERWLKAIHRHRGTMSGGPNFAYELCLRRLRDEDIEGIDLSCWRLAFNGAEPVSPQTLHQFGQRFSRFGLDPKALAPVYGLAEATLGVAFTPIGRGVRLDRVERAPMVAQGRAIPSDASDPDPLTFVSSGVPIPGFEVRTVDEAGRETAERCEGRLEFRGPSTTSGYFRNPEVTRELFHDGWLDSGDRGYVAEGEVYVTGRAKDVIIRAGRNIYPYELEEAVAEIDGVRRGCVAVFGGGDPVAGTERLVVVAESRATSPEARAGISEQIEALTVEILAMPADDVVVAPPGTVLKTSSGKIRRVALRDLYDRGAIEFKQRPVWLQLMRLGAASMVPEIGRWWRRTGELAYALYMGFLFALGSCIAWPLVVLVPGIGRRWRMLGGLGRLLLALGGASPRVHDTERVPKDGGFVLVANHSSYLDGLVLVSVLHRPVRFVAKKELAENFFTRLFLARLGCLFVERFDRARSAEDASHLGRQLQAGHSLAFFPEGTFHRMPGLLPFHLGAFLAAVQAGVPVVPVTLRGTRSILRGDSLFARRGRIRVQVGEPLEAGATSPEDPASTWDRAIGLRDDTRAQMLAACGEPDLADRRELSW